MNASGETQRGCRLKPWQTIVLFGFLLCVIYAFGSFTLDYYAGVATDKFGRMGAVSGIGMFFIYVLSYFIALVVILPILIVRRFGVGLAVYLPYAIIGLFVDYYIEWVVYNTLISPWAVVGWCVFGLLTGLSADLAYRFLPGSYSERKRAILTGIVLSAALFVFVLIAVEFFYKDFPPEGPGTFLSIAYYGVPLLLVNSAFGGYTAYAISKRV